MSHVHFFRGIAAGALAGLAASYVMNELQTHKPAQIPENAKRRRAESESSSSQQQEQSQQQPESGDDATVKTAQRISQKVLQHELTPAEKRLAGPAVHYTYGTLMGGLYGGLAELLPVVSAGVGMPFGFALWLFGDEIAVPALGLGKPPTETPVEVHADTLAAHFMYGATTDLLRRVLRHVL